MKPYDVVQWLIVAAVVMVSALYLLGRLAPHWRMQLAQHLQQPRYVRWINRLGAGIGSSAAECGACDKCGACARSETATDTKQR